MVVREVAEHMGNTPAVARASYIDPRVLDRFLDEGATVDLHGIDPDGSELSDEVDTAVLTFLTEDKRQDAAA